MDRVEHMVCSGRNRGRCGSHRVAGLAVDQTPFAGVIRLVQLELGLMLRIRPLHIEKTRDEQEC